MADGNAGPNTLRVMIVEDNEALAQTTGWLVEMLGYDYRLAANGKQAIEMAKDYRPDVMMLDIGLPGMNGYELCQVLKPMPELADTVFIAQTGWGESEHRRLTKEAGFDHHLVKPLYLEALQTLLGEIEAKVKR
jgi:CheY-like chemotaxis protein